ncbi:MAG: response regulator [Acidobacteriota bacterium]
MMTMNPPNVLVVDDDPDFVAYVKTVLEADGISVAAAYDGEDALEQVREEPPDLVTLDIQMPRKTGVLFYRQMKAEERLRAIPVIVVTGLRRMDLYAAPFIQAFFEVEHRKLPVPEAYLDKPVSREELVKTVREYLAA